MADDEEVPTTEGYKVSKKVDVNDIMNQDADDESLKRYKEALLGAALNEDVSPKDDPRRVVIKEMVVEIKDAPDHNIVMNLEEKGSELLLKDKPFTIKEDAEFKTRIKFKVQHEIVSGLKLVNTTSRGPVKQNDSEMLGSFPPQKEYHEIIFPRHSYNRAPSGMIARGKYNCRNKFVDDDGACHLSYDFVMEIKKAWN